MAKEKYIKRGLAAMILIMLVLIWMIGNSGMTEPLGLPRETDLDLPGDFERFYDYGERVNAWRERYGIRVREDGRYGVESVGRRYLRYGEGAVGDRFEAWDLDRRGHEGRLSEFVKLDIDSDMNYDGTIDNYDPADQGLYETTPPGVIMGEGELAKLIIRFRMNHVGFQEWEGTHRGWQNPRTRVHPQVHEDSEKRLDSAVDAELDAEEWKAIQSGVGFQGHAVVTMEVVGINREVQSGLFKNFNEEKESTGRIRVWADEKKKKLLLDSGVASKRVYQWSAENRFFPENLPGGVPRIIYVEGVSKYGNYIGDLRILVTVSWVDRNVKRGGQSGGESVAEVNRHATMPIDIGNRSFRAAYDHILFTVKEEPQKKEFINNNAERIWFNPDGTLQTQEQYQ